MLLFICCISALFIYSLQNGWTDGLSNLFPTAPVPVLTASVRVPTNRKKAIEITNLFRATQTMAPLPLPRFVSPRTEKRRLRLLICFVQHKPWHHCHCLGSCLLESKKRRLRLLICFVQHKPWHHCHCLGSCPHEPKKGD